MAIVVSNVQLSNCSVFAMTHTIVLIIFMCMLSIMERDRKRTTSAYTNDLNQCYLYLLFFKWYLTPTQRLKHTTTIHCLRTPLKREATPKQNKAIRVRSCNPTPADTSASRDGDAESGARALTRQEKAAASGALVARARVLVEQGREKMFDRHYGPRSGSQSHIQCRHSWLCIEIIKEEEWKKHFIQRTCQVHNKFSWIGKTTTTGRCVCSGSLLHNKLKGKKKHAIASQE